MEHTDLPAWRRQKLYQKGVHISLFRWKSLAQNQIPQLDFAKMPSWDTFLDCPILAVMGTHLRAQDISKLLFVIHVQRTTRNVLMDAVHLLLDSILKTPCSWWAPEVLLCWLPSACIANTHYQTHLTWALERKPGTVLSYLLSLTQGHIFDNI